MQNKTSVAQVGLFAAMLLIINNMLGSGVFLLPATLAKIGGISLIGWLVAMVGVISLALVFAKLSKLLPGGAGPYDYVKKAFGNYAGFQINYVYSIASWIGNVSMISVILGYLANIFNIFNSLIYGILLQVSIIWLFTFLNIKGARIVSIVQSVSLFLALIPIIFIAVIGWYWFSYEIFIASWNVSNLSAMAAIDSSFNNIMWAFIGIESACVSATLIKNPKRNIPLATVFGVIIVTFLYISTCTVIMGIVPNANLVKSSAPFADVLQFILGREVAIVVSVFAIVNCLGALTGWTMVIGQTARAAAEDGLFPKIFAKTNSKGVPAIGLILLAIIMTIVAILTASPSANEQFQKIITMSVILYLIPYIYSSFAVIVIGFRNMQVSEYIISVTLGIIASFFCMWSISGSDRSVAIWAFLVMMTSMIFYAIKKNHDKVIKNSYEKIDKVYDE